MGLFLFFKSKMVKGVGVSSMSKNINQYWVVGRQSPSEANPEPTCYRIRVFAKNTVIARSRFWYQMKRQNKVRRTQGKSSQSVKSLRDPPTLSETTALSSSITPETISSTCTRSTETTVSAEPSLKCTVKWPVDTVPEETLFTSSRPSSSQTTLSRENKLNNTLEEASSTQRSPTEREHQPQLTMPLSPPADQPASELDLQNLF